MEFWAKPRNLAVSENFQVYATFVEFSIPQLLFYNLNPSVQSFLKAVEFWANRGIWPFWKNFKVYAELCGIWYRLVITFIFKFEPKFAKLLDKTINFKSTDYFSNQQNSAATQKNIPTTDEV